MWLDPLFIVIGSPHACNVTFTYSRSNNSTLEEGISNKKESALHCNSFPITQRAIGYLQLLTISVLCGVFMQYIKTCYCAARIQWFEGRKLQWKRTWTRWLCAYGFCRWWWGKTTPRNPSQCSGTLWTRRILRPSEGLCSTELALDPSLLSQYVLGEFK